MPLTRYACCTAHARFRLPTGIPARSTSHPTPTVPYPTCWQSHPRTRRRRDVWRSRRVDSWARANSPLLTHERLSSGDATRSRYSRIRVACQSFGPREHSSCETRVVSEETLFLRRGCFQVGIYKEIVILAYRYSVFVNCFWLVGHDALVLISFLACFSCC